MMQTFELLFKKISSHNEKWSYYEDTKLDIVSIEALSSGVKIAVNVSDPGNPDTLQFQESIRQLQDWVAVTVKESKSTAEIFFTLSPLKTAQFSYTI